MGTNHPMNTSTCYTCEGEKRSFSDCSCKKRMYNRKNWETKKKPKQAKASPREADEKREHSMTKHWAHLPHPLKQHFVSQVNSTYSVGSAPFPLLPSHPNPLVQQYRILHILCWYTHAGQWHRYTTHAIICLSSLVQPAVPWNFAQLFESKKKNYIIW